MRAKITAAIGIIAILATPLSAQDDGGSQEIVVTAQMNRNFISAPGLIGVGAPAKPPVIGLKRQADSAVRNIEIISDSRESDMRQREVQTMLLSAIDRAQRDGLFLVTGQYELVPVTRENWKDQFPGLATKAASVDDDDDEDDNEDYDDDDDEDNAPQPAFEDDGNYTKIRLKVKTRLDGSIDAAQKKIAAFVKGVPVSGRSVMEQKGGLQLTIVKPEQYRDAIYKLIADGTQHAVSYYGPEYSAEITGLSQDIAWQQVSNTQVFLYIPYIFTVRK